MSTSRSMVSPTAWFDWLRSPAARWLTVPLFAFCFTRAIVFFGAYATQIFDYPDAAAADPIFYNPGPWGRWDVTFYRQIVESGYTDKTIAFFPAYPMLVSAVRPLFGDHFITAGVAVSNVCFFVGLLFLYQLCMMDLPESDARRAVFYFAAFPTTIFFSVPYTESLFFMLSVMAVYFARRRWWLAATIAAALVSATRIPGIFVGGLVGLEWLASHGWTLKTLHRADTWRSLWKAIRTDFGTLLLIGLSASGLAAFMIYNGILLGNMTRFFEVQANWGHIPPGMSNPISVLIKDIVDTITTPPTPQVSYLRTHLPYFRLVEVAAFCATCILSIFIWRRINERYALYCFVSVLLPSMSRMGSMLRFVILLFPLAMLLALWGRSPKVNRVIVWLFPILLGICAALFAEGYWLG